VGAIDVPDDVRRRCWCRTSAAWTGHWRVGVAEIAIFGSATESFAAKNPNSTMDEQFVMFEPVVRRAFDAGPAVRGYGCRH